ncbi:MAG TPA: aminotransferase class I/II-fold pyridoxal phosphate-dependent enzyme, partial [Accumulibacter sp.]|nr:aminotransferase class I/II-fold pyridoxal phosphate-dependent enzyme [Accumulibacter sp.]
MTASIFAAVEMAPRDPILGLTESFNADSRPTRVNLGVGVYLDDNGKVPLLNAVKQAEKARLEAMPPRSYQPIDGLAAYNQAVQKLLFGEQSPLLSDGRVITVQALGGTGALKIGADYLRRLLPDATVYLSDPSWENHRALFEFAGFQVQNYPYYQPTTRAVDFAAMCEGLQKLPAGSIVVLHACCHNPTGADLDAAQWRDVVDIIGEQEERIYVTLNTAKLSALQLDSNIIWNALASQNSVTPAGNYDTASDRIWVRV